MLASREHCSTATTVKLETYLSELGLALHPMAEIRNNKNKRRFSDEQIKSLEFMFESESRPESRLKQQLANELGLQPRQVAIWFQNRRARLKSKQIEQDYSILKASYDNLLSSFESLKKENQSLLVQLQKLKNTLGKRHRSTNWGVDHTGSSSDGKSETGDTITESKAKPNILFEGSDHIIDVPSTDDNSRDVESIGEDITIPNKEEPIDGSLSLSGNWCSLESNSFLVESSCNSQWWDYWS